MSVIQPRIREIKNGMWIKKGNEVFWKETMSTSEYDFLLREWKKPQETVTLKTPTEAGFGLMKSIMLRIIVQDVERISRFKSKTIFWLYECTVSIRPEREHLFLKLEKDCLGVNKLHILDLWHGSTFQLPLRAINESTNDFIVEYASEEPTEIDFKSAKSIASEKNILLYDSVDENGNFGKQCELRD